MAVSLLGILRCDQRAAGHLPVGTASSKNGADHAVVSGRVSIRTLRRARKFSVDICWRRSLYSIHDNDFISLAVRIRVLTVTLETRTVEPLFRTSMLAGSTGSTSAC